MLPWAGLGTLRDIWSGTSKVGTYAQMDSLEQALGTSRADGASNFQTTQGRRRRTRCRTSYNNNEGDVDERFNDEAELPKWETYA